MHPLTASAITFSRYGGPEVLTLSQVEIPNPGPGFVRVRVRAAGVNPFDLKLRRGDLAQMFPVSFPVTPGIDAAGTVDAIGLGVAGISVGDAVLGVAAAGSYAQYALFPAPVNKPAEMSWELAAALPTIGEAAFRALHQLDVAAGQTLLIHGAAGSVGAIATQLAVSRNIAVIGSVAERDFDEVRALGAVPVRYGDGLAERVRAAAPQGIDAVLDTAGHGVLSVSIDIAGGPERVLTIADMEAAKYGVRFSGANAADRLPRALPDIVRLAALGQLRVTIGATYRLGEAARAHADIEAGTVRGKVILLPQIVD